MWDLLEGNAVASWTAAREGVSRCGAHSTRCCRWERKIIRELAVEHGHRARVSSATDHTNAGSFTEIVKGRLGSKIDSGGDQERVSVGSALRSGGQEITPGFCIRPYNISR